MSVLNDSNSNLPQPSLVLRPREAAISLAISERTLHDLMRNGEIPYTKLKRAVLIRVSDLEAFLDRNATKGGGAQ